MITLSKLLHKIMATPAKPTRKKAIEVPVHKSTHEIGTNTSKRHKQKIDDKLYKHEITLKNDNVDTVNSKISRRYLHKENQRLARDNEDVIAKFNELEGLSIKKITKMKERIASLQNINDEMNRESSSLKGQIQELLVGVEELKYQVELSKYCKSCDQYKITLEQYCKDNDSLKKVKHELEEDLNMLKTVVYRLNVQMERYQEKIRIVKSKDLMQAQSLENIATHENDDPIFLSELHQDHTHTPVSWGKVNVHALGPLLDAYQDSIMEKEEIIQNYETELANFTGKLKVIVGENEKLHKLLTEDRNCSSLVRKEAEELQKDLKDVKEQNDGLIKKCALKQDKLEEVIKCYETKMEQLKRDYGVVHEQYCKSRTEVAALREKNRTLVDSQDSFKSERDKYIPITVHTSSVNECKKWYEELKNQYELERKKLKESFDCQAKLIAELKDTNSSLENKIKQLEKQIKKGESKHLELEHSLNEVQVSRSACRKQLHKAMNFAKDLVAEQETLLTALDQRQEENKVVKKIGSEIATRMNSLKSQLKDVQKGAWQEFSTVEKRIEDQNQAIEAMKEEHNTEIERLQLIIKEQEESALLLKEQSTLPKPHYLLFRDKHNQ